MAQTPPGARYAKRDPMWRRCVFAALQGDGQLRPRRPMCRRLRVPGPLDVPVKAEVGDGLIARDLRAVHRPQHDLAAGVIVVTK